VKCKYCGEQKIRGEVKNHEEDECLFKTVNCINKGCNVKLMKKEIPAHKEVCLFEPLICMYCGEEKLRHLLKSHEDLECDKKTENCTGCKKEIVKKNMKGHMEICEDIEICCQQCEFTDKRRAVEKHNCVAYLRKCQKEINAKINKIEEIVTFIARAFAICEICKNVAIKEIMECKKCQKCQRKGCSQCIKNCIQCNKMNCIECEKEQIECNMCKKISCNSCILKCNKCGIPICKKCAKPCPICKKEKCKECKCHSYTWMDGSTSYYVVPNAFMTTNEPLPQFCKITLKLHGDVGHNGNIGITSKQYYAASRTYYCGGSSESVECGWYWCGCGLCGCQNGPKQIGGFNGNLAVKCGDIVEIMLSKNGNFEVTRNGSYKGICYNNLGTTKYYLGVGTDSAKFTVEIVSVEEL